MKFREGPVAIGILIALALWIFVVLPIYYGPRYSEAAYAQQHTEQKSSSNDRETQPLWVPTDSVGLYTLVLAVFTGLLAVVAVFQGAMLLRADGTARTSADAAKRSADAAIAAGAARLLITPVSHNYWDVAGQYAAMFPNSPDMGNFGTPIEVSFCIKNYGKTPGTLIHILTDIALADTPPPDLPPPKNSPFKATMSDLQLPIDSIVPERGATENITVTLAYPLNITDAIAIRDGKNALWFWGGVIYWDVFDRECEQRFAFRLDRRNGRFIRHYDRTYYRAKSDRAGAAA